MRQKLNVWNNAMEWKLPASVVATRMGNRVRTRRIEKEFGVAKVASAIGRSETEMEAIEDGRDTLKAQEIITLCRIFDVPPSWFFDDLV